MQENTQEDKNFMYFNVYLQGGDVSPDLKAAFEEYDASKTGLPKEPISDRQGDRNHAPPINTNNK